MPQVSVLLPAKNEAENIGALISEIADALAGSRFEIVLVNDASEDDTAGAALMAAEAAKVSLRLVNLQHSCGQSTAIYLAALHAKGTWLVSLDADGQNDPADIPAFLKIAAQISSVHFCLIGHRQKRRDSGWKKFQSRVANAVRQTMLRDGTPDTGCGLKLVPRETFMQLPYFNHMHRYTPALVKRMGGVVQSIPVNHRPRLQGVSKYTAWNRGWAGILDIMGVMWLIYRSKQPVVLSVKSSVDDQAN